MRQSEELILVLFVIIFSSHLMCPYYMQGHVVTHCICTVTFEMDIVIPIMQMRKLNLKEFPQLAQSHTTREWGNLDLGSSPEPPISKDPVLASKALFCHWLINMLQKNVGHSLSFLANSSSACFLKETNVRSESFQVPQLVTRISPHQNLQTRPTGGSIDDVY